MKDFNEGFTRLSKASTGIADRVPFTTQMHEFAMTWCDVPSTRFYSDANILVSGILKTAEDFEFDIPSLGYDIYSIEVESVGQPIVGSENQAPLVDKERILIREEKDLARIKPSHPPNSGRMPFVLDLPGSGCCQSRSECIQGVHTQKQSDLGARSRRYDIRSRTIRENPQANTQLHISDGRGGGRLIIYLSSLNRGTPPRHIETAVEVIKEFGEYKEVIG